MQRSSKSIFCITGISLCYLCMGNPYQHALKEFARNLQRVPRKVKAVGALSASGQALSGPKKTAQSLAAIAFNRIVGDKIQTMDELYLLRKIMDPALTAEEQNVLASSLKADLGDRYGGINSIAQQLQKLGQVGSDLLDKHIQEISDQVKILIHEMSPEQLKQHYDAMRKNNNYSRVMWHELERAYYLKTGQLLSPKPAGFKFGYSLEEIAATADPQIIEHVVRQVTSHPGDGVVQLDSWPSEKGMDIEISFRTLLLNATIVSIQGLMALLKSANYDPESIGNLNIENNEITELPAEGFVGLKNLKSLSLANNHIVQLSEKSFAGLVNLESLSLYYNKIQSLPAKALVGLQRLRFVSLAHNRIEKLTAETFANATSLVSLDLSNNNISALSANMLVGLKNLKKLWLIHNQIHLLDARTFIGFKELETLVLMDNRISKLPQHAFLGLESLSYLNLSKNSLEQLPNGLFEGLKNLTRLELGGNSFKGSNLDLPKLKQQYPGLF